jgi:hypothetical protein
MGLLWGTAWFLAGMVLLFIVGFGAADVPFPLFFGLLGFLAGVSFSLVLGAIESRRRFDEIGLPRFAAWGAAGGVLMGAGFSLLGALFGDMTMLSNLPMLSGIFGTAGAVSAAGSLALARRANSPALDAGEVERLDQEQGEVKRLLDE